MRNSMCDKLLTALRTAPLTLLLLAVGCSGDESTSMAEDAPDADVLRVLGVPAAPGGAPGKDVPTAAPAEADKAPASAAAPENASGASRPLKVEIREPRFDGGKQAPAPSVADSPGSSLDY